MYSEINNIINDLVKRFNYKKLPTILSQQAREKYTKSLDLLQLHFGDEMTIILPNNNKLCTVDRIVIGDYGAYYEVSSDNIDRSLIENTKGQEYRFKDPKYKDNVKYYWLNPKGYPDVKIYYQVKAVSYADYKPGKIYISCFDETISYMFEDILGE